MKQEIIKILSDVEQKEKVEQYAAYCERISKEKNKDGTLKNKWMQYKKPEELAGLFRRVMDTGLWFDGVHVTLQSTGITYDYIAYKNKMLIAYPESKIDISVVNEGDEFNFSKENGVVSYKHNIANPFAKENIVGAYCIIKNKRGEFLTLLSKEELEKHRKVAKTDFIWRAWYKEMVMKTVIKKAVKIHFDDIYEKIEEVDNENYDLDNPLNLDIQYKSDIDDIDTIEELHAYYLAHKGKGKEFDAYVTKRKNELQGS